MPIERAPASRAALSPVATARRVASRLAFALLVSLPNATSESVGPFSWWITRVSWALDVFAFVEAQIAAALTELVSEGGIGDISPLERTGRTTASRLALLVMVREVGTRKCLTARELNIRCIGWPAQMLLDNSEIVFLSKGVRARTTFSERRAKVHCLLSTISAFCAKAYIGLPSIFLNPRLVFSSPGICLKFAESSSSLATVLVVSPSISTRSQRG